MKILIIFKEAFNNLAVEYNLKETTKYLNIEYLDKFGLLFPNPEDCTKVWNYSKTLLFLARKIKTRLLQTKFQEENIISIKIIKN